MMKIMTMMTRKFKVGAADDEEDDDYRCLFSVVRTLSFYYTLHSVVLGNSCHFGRI